MKINAPISVGELIDKMTILAIKLERLVNPAQLANVRAERDLLAQLYADNRIAGRVDREDEAALGEVNRQLWDIEDRIRECEARRDFGPEFVELARSVYRLNDIRAARKRAINDASGSAIVEEKSYSGTG